MESGVADGAAGGVAGSFRGRGPLGFGRAVGETMVVLMASGNASSFPGIFSESARTMTATIAAELGEQLFSARITIESCSSWDVLFGSRSLPT